MTPKESKQEIATLILEVNSARSKIARTIESGAVNSIAETYLFNADEKLAEALTNLDFAFHFNR